MDEYNRVFRKKIARSIPKHDCMAMLPKDKQTKFNNSRYMVAMELRAQSEPKQYSEKSLSAHQFSAHDMSVQADSEEREENATLINTIDLKSKMQKKINIYDLSPMRKGVDPHNQSLLKEKKDVGVVTEFHRRLLSTQDWFYSKLYRDMATTYYERSSIYGVPEGI